MGRESRQRAAGMPDRIAAHLRELGDPVYFGSHLSGCPKCRTVFGEGIALSFCLGSVPGKASADPHACPVEGEHIHVTCRCGYMWLELPADDAENPLTGPDEKHMLSSVAYAVLASLLYELGRNEQMELNNQLIALFTKRAPAIVVKFDENGGAVMKLDPWPELQGPGATPKLEIAGS